MATRYAKDHPPEFTNYIRKVAIVGATGQMGQHLLRELKAANRFTITVLQRPASSACVPTGPAMYLSRVDYNAEDDSLLVAALRGQDALLITMAVTAPRDTVSKLAAAAAKAGVRYVLPNWYGHDPNNDALCADSFLAPRRDAIIAQIAATESKYLLLCCNFWYEFSLGGGPDRFGFDFPCRELTWFDDGDVPINTTTWPASGKAVANLLSLEELPDDATDSTPTLSRYANAAVYVSSFRVTQRDIFASVKRVTGTSDADWTIRHDKAQPRWEKGAAEVRKGNYDAYTKMLYSRMFFPNGGGDYESARGLDNKDLGLGPEDLDEWTGVAVRMAEGADTTVSH